MQKKIDWYFDFISPFAYLASESLERLPGGVTLRPRPILFGGLLDHWQTRGPAEIEPMRRFTFRHVRWLADRHGIALQMPPAHPFNPLRLLRLCIALDSDLECARKIFRFVWREGRSADKESDWRALLKNLGVEDGDRLVAQPAIKDALRRNTEQAIEQGVFGVPGFAVDGEIFWGFDSIDFLLDYLRDPGLLRSPEMVEADRMPEGPGRFG